MALKTLRNLAQRVFDSTDLDERASNFIRQAPQQAIRNFNPIIGQTLGQVPRVQTRVVNKISNSRVRMPTPFGLKKMPYTYGQNAEAIADFTYRIPARAGAKLGLEYLNKNNTFNKSFSHITPNTNLSRAVLGKDPITPFSATSTKTSNFLQNPNVPIVNKRLPFSMSRESAQRTAPILAAGVVAADLVPFGLGRGKQLSKAATYVKQVAGPEDIAKITKFAAWASKGGRGDPIRAGIDPNELREVQAMARDIFGDKATHLTNKQLANAFDTVLAEIGRGKNNLNLGLSIDDVSKGRAVNESVSDAKNASSQIPKLVQGAKKTAPLKQQLQSQRVNPQPLSEIISNQGGFSKNYVDELTRNQQSARGGGDIAGRVKGLGNEVRTKLVDEFTPIESAVAKAQKAGKYEIRPQNDVRMQIDRAIRADTLAGRFIEDHGLAQVIREVPDVKALDQYMIAKHAATVEKTGRATGRNLAKDQQLIKELGGNYEQYAKRVNKFSQDLLDYSADAGLINKKLATQLKKDYPEYVPLKRIFNELEKQPANFGGGGKVSVSRQTVVQKLKGSDREIESPIESLVEKATVAFNQGERNQAARMLASYEKLPGFEGLIREIKQGDNVAHTFSFLDDGVKRTFETTPEIAAAAKNLNRQQIGILGQIFAVPTRILRLGATGINIPFVTANIAKDQLFAFVTSNKALSTSVANPANFARSFLAALRHDQLYDDMIRSAGGGFSMEIARNQPRATVAGIRADRNLSGKAIRRITHPGELLRSVENVISRSEELTRVQQFQGTKNAYLKEGRSLQDAQLLAAQASRQNTANFMRAGEYGRVINLIIPYFNAGIQGARSLVRAGAQRPVETASKLAVGLYLPVVSATLWNTGDPERRAIYDDIADFEKENNIIIVSPGSAKDEKGRYNVIKIPLNPGLGALANLVRRPMEEMAGTGDASLYQTFADLVLAGTSQDISSVNKVMSTYTPQTIKPGLESYTNTNLFTGRQIVPEYLKDRPENEQVKDYTSGSARIIGGALNASPLKVENFIRTGAGGVGQQVLNVADSLLYKAGKIPQEQVGGEDVGSATLRRFTKATGGQGMSDFFQGKGEVSGSSIKQDDKLYYKDGDGKIQTFDLTPKTGGSGIGALANTDWKEKQAAKLWNIEGIPQEEKNKIYKEWGIEPEDARYAALAGYNEDVSVQWLVSKSGDSHDKLLENLITGRVVGITGEQFASNGVIDELYDQGYINEAEKKALKAIRVDKNGKSLVQAKGGKKLKKLSIPKGKAVKLPTLTYSKLSSAPKLSLPRAPKGNVKLVKSQPQQFKLKGLKNTLTGSSKVLY